MAVELYLHILLLVVLYSAYGLLQDRIMKAAYGNKGEHFESSSLIVFGTSLTTTVLLGITSVWMNRTKSTWSDRMLRPSMPWRNCAVAAAVAFFAMCCQYQVLARVTYITTSLAKMAQVVPLFIVQQLCSARTTGARDYFATGLVLLGFTTYLTTFSAIDVSSEDVDLVLSTVVGAIALVGYLTFDAIAFATRERFFTPPTTDSLAPGSTLLPHLFFFNVFLVVYSIGGLVMDGLTGTLAPSLDLLLNDSDLQLHFLALSFTVAIGTIALLSTTSSFGSITSDTVLVLQPLLGILIDAYLYRRWRLTGLQGWLGAGWVAGGLYLHLNARYAQGASPSMIPESESLLVDSEKARSRSPSPTRDQLPLHSSSPEQASNGSIKYYMVNYILPVTIPLVLPLVIFIVVPDFTATISHPDTPAHAAPQEHQIALPSDDTVVEGGEWEHELHNAIRPICDNNGTTFRWEGNRRTALASNPRSGNTFTRELVERATGWQTSTISYCDTALRPTFAGECDHTANFLVKTHYPERASENDLRYSGLFDQAVHLVRNPVDALYSGWHMAHVPKTPTGTIDHTGRLDIDKLGSTAAQKRDLMNQAQVWANHEQFWHEASVPTLPVRYEDMTSSRIAPLLSILSFLLPAEDLPPLSQISCATELDENKEAYKSRKSAPFDSWDKWDPDTRTAVIKSLKVGWCRHGYNFLLEETRGVEDEVADLCSQR